jgi:hypothetical protein
MASAIVGLSRLDWPGQVKYIRGVMDGGFGFDWKFIFDSLIGPDLDLEPPTEISLEQLALSRRLRVWAHRYGEALVGRLFRIL